MKGFDKFLKYLQDQSDDTWKAVLLERLRTKPIIMMVARFKWDNDFFVRNTLSLNAATIAKPLCVRYDGSACDSGDAGLEFERQMQVLRQIASYDSKVNVGDDLWESVQAAKEMINDPDFCRAIVSWMCIDENIHKVWNVSLGATCGVFTGRGFPVVMR